MRLRRRTGRRKIHSLCKHKQRVRNRKRTLQTAWNSEEERARTGICLGDGGGALEEAGVRSSSVSLVKAVEGVGSVSLKGVGREAKAVGLNGSAIGSAISSTCRVQCSLQYFLAHSNLCHAPTPSSHHLHYHCRNCNCNSHCHQHSHSRCVTT